jgi:glycerol-3-phosphate dehydrogenase
LAHRRELEFASLVQFDIAKGRTLRFAKSQHDAVILGAGHNKFVVATYLARAGLSVLLLEKNDYIAGATILQTKRSMVDC